MLIAHESALVSERNVSFLSALCGIAAISASLAFYNLGFPAGIHPDEFIKVQYATGQAGNYSHPPLLIVLARFAVWLSGATTDYGVLLAGRSVSALACVGASVLFYLTLRRQADGRSAFLWACVFAVSPAIAVHAHFFKEDALLVFGICMSLHALLRLKEELTTINLQYFGLAIGLAAAAKYPGAVNSFVLLGIAIPYCRLRWRQAAVISAIAAVVVLATFAISLSTEIGSGLARVAAGFAFELQHVETGHDLKEWFWEGYGLTHFRYHLIPSLTGPTLLIALGTTSFALLVDRNKQVAAYVAAALGWLFVLELSPLKMIGFMRYVLPVVVYLLLAAGVACSQTVGWRSRRAAFLLGAVAVAASGFAGVAYVSNMQREHDTRFAAMRFMEQHDIKRFLVDYPMGEPALGTNSYRDLSKADYLISLKFQRYLRGGTLTGQDPAIYELAGMFRCLDRHIVAKFSNFYGDYGYVAPTVNIYDLRDAQSCFIEQAT